MTIVDIKHNQRVAYIGKTGSGKTFLARHNLAMISRLIVLDAKGTISAKEWNLSTDGSVLRRLKAGQPGRFLVRGIRAEDFTPTLDLAWQIGNIVVYVDEMALVNPSSRPTFELARLYQQGREKQIGVQASTQRPRNVPAIMFSEADWIFAFRMSRREDRKTVADYGDEAETMLRPIRDTHGFYTYHPSWDRAIYTARYTPQKARVYAGADVKIRIAERRTA